jgi:hypothetical protein
MIIVNAQKLDAYRKEVQIGLRGVFLHTNRGSDQTRVMIESKLFLPSVVAITCRG